MISEEEKKAIKFLESDKEMLKENYNFGKEAKARIASDIEKGLNIIEKQQAEYSDLKLKYEQGLLLHKKHVSDLEIKDKIIDEMADLFLTIAKNNPGTIFHYLEKNGFLIEQCSPCNKQEIQTCADCFKQHFRKKVEND